MAMCVQLWESFRQKHLKLHRKLGYVAVIATALGSISGAPYAITYLCSSELPEQVSSNTADLPHSVQFTALQTDQLPAPV